MAGDPIADPLASQPPKWLWWSTPESIELQITSISAIVETLIAVPFYWWATVHFHSYALLILSACVAPLVLMRSDQSIALGVKWFTQYAERVDKGTTISSLIAFERAITSAFSVDDFIEASFDAGKIVFEFATTSI